jgi:DNA-binding FadR family transcriptional regulator
MDEISTGDASIDIIERMIERRLDGASPAASGRLPTERALAAELGATRHVVRRALERLEAKGRIWRHVGRGTFIGPRPEFDPSDLAAVVRHSSPREIVETRQMLEPQIAAAAAIHASPAQVAAIEDAFRRCAAARNMDVYETWDEEFHRAIAAATGNMLLRALFEAVNRARKAVVWGTMRRAMLKPERRDVFTREHARVVEAIGTRNAPAAWQAMREHMATLVGVYSAVEQARAVGHGPISI